MKSAGKLPGLLVRGGLTAALLFTILLRIIRAAANWESVAGFYRVDSPWALLAAVLFLGPFLAALSAVGALWRRWDQAAGLAAVNFCASGFFALWEGMTVFARAMDGHTAYAGARASAERRRLRDFRFDRSGGRFGLWAAESKKER